MFRQARCISFFVSACCFGLCANASTVRAEYQVITVSDGGTITGQAVWNGAIPKMPPLRVFADMDVCGTEAPSPALRVDQTTNGVQDVLVYLERVERGKAPASTYRLHMGRREETRKTDLATQRCQFQEQVFPFVRTADITMTNFESVLHNPHFFGEKRASLFNLAMPTADRDIGIRLPRARGVGLRLQCDVHVHMNAWAAAMDHPYFAVTDEQGRFEIAGIPPGTYTLVAWHAGYNIVKFVSSRPLYDEPHVIRRSVEIAPKASVEQRFEFPVRAVEVEWKIAGGDGEPQPE